MNAETGRVMQAPEAILPTVETHAGWRIALPLVVMVCAGIVAMYWGTAESMVRIWARSETFQHGFLILPISLFLIWTRRREVAKLVPAPDYLGLVLVAAAGLVWLIAAAGQVQVVQQYAMVAMIPAAVIALAGREVAWALAFPLAFLLLAVPIGEGLIPPLMDWTADFTVAALRLTGIPVYREGNFFTIPSGNWSVVEGCSGVRYLIASITVGVLYAYLSYQKLWKRLLFIAVSVVVPVLANWLRAYMIVMIGHLSDGKLAHGVDHLIYGWVFFGIVMLLMFWIGNFWRENRSHAVPDDRNAISHGIARASRASFAVAAVAAVVFSGAWPLYAAHIDRTDEASAPLRLELPAAAAGWALDATPVTDWRPRYEGAPASFFQSYRKDDRTVVLYVGYYPRQQENAKLVTSTNIMVVQKHPVWSNLGESRRVEDFGKGPQELRQTLLRSRLPPQRLLVWDWFRISGRDLTNPYLAKLLFVRDKLLGNGDEGSAIIIGTPYEESTDAAAETLRQFVREMTPSIDATLMRVAADAQANRHVVR